MYIQIHHNNTATCAYNAASRIEYKCNHVCFSWRGSSENEVRCNDAGEPNGTAGRSIYAAMQSHNVYNTSTLSNINHSILYRDAVLNKVRIIHSNNSCPIFWWN